MEKEIVNEINQSGFKLYFALTGGGTKFLAEYIQFGGASQSLIGANIPYSQRAFDNFTGQKVEKYASEDAAKKLAVASFNECLKAGIEPEKAVGVGASCSIASAPEREGRKHKIHIAFHTYDMTISKNAILNQGRSREEEEVIITHLIYKELAYITLKNFVQTSSEEFVKSDEIYWADQSSKNKDFIELYYNKKDLIYNWDKTKTPQILPIYCGSWNPLHEGHKTIYGMANEILQSKVVLELTIKNAEKGNIDYLDIERRHNYIKEYPHIITGAPFVRNKIEVIKREFPKSDLIFVVGYDTWKRIWDKKYCLNGSIGQESDFFAKYNVRFLVFGRGEEFKPLCDISEFFRIRNSQAEEFNMDVSSSKLRAQR